ncbi:hypothetical protein Tco_0389234 [Tanacetum coccineum]
MPPCCPKCYHDYEQELAKLKDAEKSAFEVQSNLPQRLRNAKTQSGESESETKAKMPYQSQLDRQTLTISMRFLRSKTPVLTRILAECQLELKTRRAVMISSKNTQNIATTLRITSDPLQSIPTTTHTYRSRSERCLHRSYYEVLESLLRGRRRHARNKDVRTELDYYSEEYDEEREMEPRPVRVREATHVLRTGSLRAWRHRGRVVEFEEALNRDGSMVERESGQEAFRLKGRRRGAIEEIFYILHHW